ncbi:TetR/AcrR family transcriptional regulator [Solimonas marina]|uniref:TetR/AcrR family transcriptional regulator n=1 Tax=Solimonas marina TaxID=2714601 RepID=A0A969WCZ9_9GAMM|nr:TetR/AcrR family transcriptional regulator [Solimonas marina]NKF24269.1 TetR/AcrR family transcriptional regulator [Solimonas marina]
MTSSKAPARGRRFRGLDTKERQRQRREQLVAAGLEMFGTRGYHSVGVREICAEAKLTERYFYESFSNREALFQAVYNHGIDTIRAAVMQSIMQSGAASGAGRDMRAVARTTIRAFLSKLRDDPRLSRVLMMDSMTVSSDVGLQSQIATQSFADLIGGMIRSAYPELPQLGIDGQLLADGLIGSTVYLAIHWTVHDFAKPLDVIVDHCVLLYDAVIAESERRLATLQPAD